MIKNSSLFILLLCCSVFFVSACGQKENFGSLYISTLSDSSLSDTEKLENYINISESSNTYIAQQAALQSLYISSSISDDKILQRAKAMHEKFGSNEKIRLRYVQLLFEQEAYDSVLLVSQSVVDSSDEAVAIRGLAVQSARFIDTATYISYLIDWYSSYAIGPSHIEFLENNVFQSLPSALRNLCLMRVRVAQRDYALSALYAEQLIEDCTTSVTSINLYSRLIFSDIGKAFLYGNNEFVKNAQFFETVGKAENLAGIDHLPFIAFFYAGRLYERAGMAYWEKALLMYEASFSCASNENYDNALWYYLSLLEKISLPKTLLMVEQTISLWFDPLYYADLLENVSVRLLSEKKWNEYFRIFTIIEEYADPETVAKYAYITGRLIEEGLIQTLGLPLPEANECYEKAFYGNHISMYYRVLAAEKLNIPIEDSDDSFFYRKKTENFIKDEDACEVLILYAENGLFDQMYSLFFEHAEHIPLDVASYLASLMASQGSEDPSLYSRSIRLILKAVQTVDTPLNADILAYLYPRFYAEIVQDECKKHDLPEYLMFALIRSESLFNKDVTSYAGAIGLSQLMVPTAGDVARKLKVDNFDLKDAQTNVSFGAFYLKELIGRLDSSVLLSLFSYNAGISRVRSWVRDDSGLPIDLFLETVPYTETRDYGRKILAAAAFYGYLYYGMSTHEIVDAIMR